MGLLELLFLAVGLSMDAFAVAICKGLALPRLRLRHTLKVGLWFGSFQALMPLMGYLLGVRFRECITAIDHWIAFILLALIGGNMVWQSLSQEEEALDAALDMRSMLLLSVATSIDALAMGVSFAFLNVDILPAVSLIGVTTFLLSAVGVKIGNVFGVKYKSKAELAGGIILVLLGIKILLEHLKILA